MTDPAVDTAELRHLDPSTLLVDLNVRHDVNVGKEFVSSVRDLGVLVPIVAVRTAEGAVRVRYGHRRVVAAIEAGRATVPVLVVADEAIDDAAQVERLVGQYAENEHRTGLSSAEQIDVIAQLSAFGISAAQIAKRTKTKRARVDAALMVSKSALASVAVERYDFLTLDQAAAIAQFEGAPDTVKALITAASTGRFEHVAQQAHDERARVQVREAFVAALREQGVTIVERHTGVTSLSSLTTADGTVLTAENHSECPGHAACLHLSYGQIDPATGLPADDPHRDDADDQIDDDDSSDPDLDEAEFPADEDDNGRPGTVWGEYPVALWVCTDAAGHGHQPRWAAYGGSAERRKLAEMTQAEADEARRQRRDVIASNKAWNSAISVRREYLRGLLARKTPPKGSAAFVATALACDADVVTRIGGNQLAAELLGCEPTGYGRGNGLAVLIESASEPRAQVLTLALILSGYEDATHTGSWRHVDPGTRRYLGFLADSGYTLSDVEHRACGQNPPNAAGQENPTG